MYFNDSFPVWVICSLCFFFPLLDDMMQKYAGSGNEGDVYAEAFEILKCQLMYFKIGICIQTNIAAIIFVYDRLCYVRT